MADQKATAVAATKHVPENRELHGDEYWVYVCPVCKRQDTTRQLGEQLCTCSALLDVTQPTEPKA